MDSEQTAGNEEAAAHILTRLEAKAATDIKPEAWAVLVDVLSAFILVLSSFRSVSIVR